MYGYLVNGERSGPGKSCLEVYNFWKSCKFLKRNWVSKQYSFTNDPCQQHVVFWFDDDDDWKRRDVTRRQVTSSLKYFIINADKYEFCNNKPSNLGQIVNQNIMLLVFYKKSSPWRHLLKCL